eukprot:1959135-Rhodomonas_salina.1
MQRSSHVLGSRAHGLHTVLLATRGGPGSEEAAGILMVSRDEVCSGLSGAWGVLSVLGALCVGCLLMTWGLLECWVMT